MIKEIIFFILTVDFINSQYPYLENIHFYNEPIRNLGFQNQFINPNYIPLTELQKYQLIQMEKAENDKLTTKPPSVFTKSNNVESFMERLADKLPEITEKVIKIIPRNFDKDSFMDMKPLINEKKILRKAHGTQITRSDNQPAEMVEINDSDDTIIKPNEEIERTEDTRGSRYPRPSPPDGTFSFIDSLPSPDTIFGFSNLFNNNKISKSIENKNENEKEIDLINIKGIPIEKDEDEEVISYEKPDEKITSYRTTKFSPQPPPPPPPTTTTTAGIVTGEFAKNILSKFLKPESESKTKYEITGEKKKDTEPTPENLISALLNGKLDKIDWISAFLGGSEDQTSNPITQLFKGGLFGSATNFDSPMGKSGKIENREFH
ncbi:Hypothetical protein SRAE_2000396400 [Strongyloides ratti]|uniref:Uncharacterized protein n=1 Tax=Strongyloides ratti TaxID=34506 RepID=A0A090MZP9_STRRB|nr:Hypothetical protein SRAE_2000396400 [Strongyloides ratti]CEF69314.1 Hypothetical protein SRAE_2000396400 [Strongyloides ratti]